MCDSSAKGIRELIQLSRPLLTLVLLSLAGRGGGDTEATSEPERSAGNHRGEHGRYALPSHRDQYSGRPRKTAQTQLSTCCLLSPFMYVNFHPFLNPGVVLALLLNSDF